eukprot:4475245-Prymnesium_polylepis.1
MNEPASHESNARSSEPSAARRLAWLSDVTRWIASRSSSRDMVPEPSSSAIDNSCSANEVAAASFSRRRRAAVSSSREMEPEPSASHSSNNSSISSSS